MTREEAIERWKAVATAVLIAESKIRSAFDEELKAAQSWPKNEQYKLFDDFCAAVAIEIVNATHEEELKQMT